jgi:hypothetical protein
MRKGRKFLGLFQNVILPFCRGLRAEWEVAVLRSMRYTVANAKWILCSCCDQKEGGGLVIRVWFSVLFLKLKKRGDYISLVVILLIIRDINFGKISFLSLGRIYDFI